MAGRPVASDISTMPIVSLDDYKKEDNEDKQGAQSHAGAQKSGLAIQNPADPSQEEQWRRITEAAGANSGPVPVDHTIVTVYRNGFIVDEGPFRPLTDAANKQFMDALSLGQQPSELQRDCASTPFPEPVHVVVNNKRSEDFKEPPGNTNFPGSGDCLSPRLGRRRRAVAVHIAQTSIVIEASKPRGTIQICFHDGQRKAQEFNDDHTVGDLRSWCQQCAGGNAMQVMGGFPPRPIVDDNRTLKAAGLLGSAVTVRSAVA